MDVKIETEVLTGRNSLEISNVDPKGNVFKETSKIEISPNSRIREIISFDVTSTKSNGIFHFILFLNLFLFFFFFLYYFFVGDVNFWESEGPFKNVTNFFSTPSPSLFIFFQGRDLGNSANKLLCLLFLQTPKICTLI